MVIWQSLGIGEDADDDQSAVSLSTNGMDTVADTMVVFKLEGAVGR